MRHGIVIGILVVALLGATLAVPAVRADEERSSWVAVLAGGNEVPAVDSLARGLAFFQLSDDGMSIRYKVIVANIVNVTMAHIHLGNASTAGGVVVWLYPSAPPPMLIEGRFQGILMEGSFDASDLVGSLAGMALGDLVVHMDESTAYVNVHTSANPGGEIRGQIAPAE